MKHIFLAVILITGIFFSLPLLADSAVDAWRHADPATVSFTLKLARRAFDSWVLHHQVIDVPSDVPPY